LASWIESMVSSMGVFGIGLLMFLENVFPPIPSELIMPLAGYSASKGDVNIVMVIVAGTIGSLAGATVWFVAGLMIGEERVKGLAARFGRWLTVTPDEVDKADAWFDRHGAKAVLIGRLVPTVRTLISVPAGLSGMSWTRFLIYSGIGTTLWTAFLALTGYALGSQYEAIEQWINPVSNLVLAAIVALYLWRVATWKKRAKAN
jgi:membrane protein DedA with SNARE-associated domain